MNIIQTLYINEGKDPLRDSFGWVAPEYHLMSWALSCLQLHKLYSHVTLHANRSAARLLVDVLGLPYSNVLLTHDDLTLADTRLWALPKVYTYSLQRAPFLHIDGDVFVFSRFAEDLLRGELIAQNIEEATEYYLTTQQELMQHFSYFPPCVQADFASPVPIRAVNAGILGGQNVAFITDYARQAQDYIARNAAQLGRVNVDRFNVFFEQHLCYSLAQEQNVPISVLFADTVNDNEYKYLGDFHEVPVNQSYLHLLGHFKRDEYTCIQMATQLRELYPEYYYKIVALYRQQRLPFFIEYGATEPLAAVGDYFALQQRAQQRYRTAAAQAPVPPAPEVLPAAPLTSFEAIAQTLIDTVTDISVQEGLRHDYQRFVLDLNQRCDALPWNDFPYLYGRDVESAGWYGQLFFADAALGAQRVVRCPEASVIESDFDWSRLVNHHKRVGVKYYETVELTPGRYFNLLVPEVHRDRLSFFDIDELEKALLDHLAEPTTIGDLLEQMRGYADDEVRQHHQALFDGFVLSLLKQLVVKKAVRPSVIA